MQTFHSADDADTDPIAAVRQHPVVVLLCALVLGAVGGLFATTQPTAYSARAVLVVEDVRTTAGTTQRAADAERYVADQVAILESRVVAQQASELVDAADPALDISVDDLLADTSVSASSDSNVIRITFVADSAAAAQAGAEAIGRSYEQVVQAVEAENAAIATAELDEAMSATVAEIGDLQRQIEELRADNAERVELDAQLDEIVAGLVDLRRESADLLQQDPGEASPGQREQVADVLTRVQLLSEELRSRLLVSEVEEQVPGTALLLRQREDAATLLSELALRRSQIEVDARLAGDGVAFLAPAGTGSPRGISTGAAVTLMAVVGAVIGVGLAYWLSRRRQRVADRRAPESVLGVPLLADVPRARRRKPWEPGSNVGDTMVPVLTEPTSPRAEAFRVIVGVLMRRLRRSGADQPVHLPDDAAGSDRAHRGIVIAVCSSTAGEGSTMVATNTALAAARSGMRTALVDAGFGARSAAGLISAVIPQPEQVRGLVDVVAGEVRLEDAIADFEVGAGGPIGLLGTGEGQTDAPELLGSHMAGNILSRLAELYDVVIVDLPPLLQVAYGSSFAQHADHALVVVRHESPLDKVRELRYRLDLIGVDALGYVYTAAPAR